MANGTTSNSPQTVKVQDTKTGTPTQPTTTQEDDGFDRLPQAKVRIPEGGLKLLLEGLSEGGFVKGFGYKIELIDDGILVSLQSNVGIYPNIRPYPIDIFIPVSEDQMPKVKNDEEGIDNRVTPESPQGSAKSQESGVGESTAADIKMASDGNPTAPTGLSGGLGEVNDTSPRITENDLSSNGLQPSIRSDASDTQLITP